MGGKKMSKIDFIMPWCNQNDEKWKEEKKKYKPSTINNENSDGAIRYRDWENLQYWFRSIEKNANWVNKIYLVVYDEVPKWLNIENPKLKIVKHKDYMPSKYLPTYNSSTIEMNIHRIEELEENFVFFNDDMFLINKVEKEDFFRNDLPVEFFRESMLWSDSIINRYDFLAFNNMSLINKYINKKDAYKKNFFKYVNYKYSLKDNLANIYMSTFRKFGKFEDLHIPVALKKSTLAKLWQLEPEAFDRASMNKYRDITDFNQYVIKYWQLASGEFYPKKRNFGKIFSVSSDNTEKLKEYDKKNYKTICFNDYDSDIDFENSKKTLNEYLEKKFPNKSSFEI
jgi:hypothetical protein